MTYSLESIHVMIGQQQPASILGQHATGHKPVGLLLAVHVCGAYWLVTVAVYSGHSKAC
jgi:hypothetical protein